MVQRALKTLQIETINKCNARCVFCAVPKQEEYRPKMTTALFEKIIDDCVELPPMDICPFLNGEPFMDDSILSKISYINKKLPESTISIYTNAYLMNKSIISDMNGLKINYFNLSLNATTDKDRVNIMGIPLKQTIENVKLLRSAYPHTRITGSLLADLCYTTRETMESFNKFCIDLGIIPLFFFPSNFAGKIRKVYNISRTCHRLDGHMTVLSTGEVCLCCQDVDGEVILGDLNNQSVKKVWEGNAFMYYYNMNLEGKRDILSFCNQCTGV